MSECEDVETELTEKGEKRVYASTELSLDCRTLVARLYAAWRDRGETRNGFVQFLREAGYDIPTRTLDHWRACVAATGEAVPCATYPGRPKALDEVQVELFVGFVLDKNSRNEVVHAATVVDFATKQLHVSISEVTALGYLHDNGFAAHVMQSRTQGFKLDNDKLCAVALQWLQELKRDGVLDTPRTRLCSVDFTFTGHRLERDVPFSLVGTPQPKSTKAISSFTNCIVTVVWADGVNRTPPILFTYNAAFRRDRRPTARRDAQLEYLDQLLKEHGIDANRIVYVGRVKNETRQYISESPALLRQFFGHYGIDDGSVALSDNGTSFYEGELDVLKDLGFASHHCYPALVHQYLSPNDNRFHGAAKKEWRQLVSDFSDDVKAAVVLLSMLDKNYKDVGTWFDTNLQLQARLPSADAVAKLIKGEKLMENPRYFQALRAYRKFQCGDARGSIPPTPPGLASGLDGKYWV